MNYYERIQNSIDFIEDNLAEEITVEQCAKQAYMSVSGYYRMFLSVVGYTVKEYIRMRRLTVAIRASISAAPSQAAPARPREANHAEPLQPIRGAPSSSRATPSEAPELIPSTKGPASGLRKRVCICNPLTASAAPAAMATMAFTRRIERTIFRVEADTSPPVRARHTSAGDRCTEPTTRSSAKSRTSNAMSSVKSRR